MIESDFYAYAPHSCNRPIRATLMCTVACIVQNRGWSRPFCRPTSIDSLLVRVLLASTRFRALTDSINRLSAVCKKPATLYAAALATTRLEPMHVHTLAYEPSPDFGDFKASYDSMPKYVPINPVGFACVNVLMQKAIGTVLVKARARVRSREWARKNPDKKRAMDAQTYKDNKALIIKRSTKWNAVNRERRNARLRPWANAYLKEKKQNDPSFHLRSKLRSRFYTVLKRMNGTKHTSTSRLAGCSPKQLQEYLDRQTLPSDEEPEVDHVFPLSVYDLQDESTHGKACHWSNLQPLSHEENAGKSNALPTKAMAAKVERWAWPPGVTEDMLPDIYDGWATPLRMHAA